MANWGHEKAAGMGSIAVRRLDQQGLANCRFPDERHGRRLHKLVEQFAGNIGGSIPWASRDWANTKAAYRFFSNPRIHEEQILRGRFQATGERIRSGGALILMLHDTTEFSFHRKDVAPVGILNKSYMRKNKKGRPLHYTVCGILMHSSLAVTTEGLPLGLAAIKFWTREEFKGCNALKRKINPTRVPIEQKESYRWLENMRQSTALFQRPEHCVHIGDREGDIYELFCAAQEAGTHFLVRTCVDRLAGDGSGTISQEMKHAPLQGLPPPGGPEPARQSVGCGTGNSLSPCTRAAANRQAEEVSELVLTVIYAQEPARPQGRDKIDWKLLTDLPVRSCLQAIEKLEWYAQRWKIETFHKILKSGCRAEESRLRTAERLVNLVAVLCILSWRIFWMTMINRGQPETAPSRIHETGTIFARHPNPGQTQIGKRKKSLTAYLIKLARLGGYWLALTTATRQQSHVERSDSSHRHRTGRHHRCSTCG